MTKENVRFADECIYCGENDTPLSAEHIIPPGLNGEWILNEASCPSCASITSKYESAVLRKHFLKVRAFLSLQSRRPENGPTKFPVNVINGVPENKFFHEPIEQTIQMFFPVYKPPRFFSDPHHLSDKSGITTTQIKEMCIGKSLSIFFAELSSNGHNGFDASFSLDTNFPLMIAKIAQSFAVGELGLINIAEQYLPDIIIGVSDDIGRWVGTTQIRISNPPDRSLHRVELDVRYNRLIVATITLFASMGAPSYTAIVGKVSDDFHNKHSYEPQQLESNFYSQHALQSSYK